MTRALALPLSRRERGRGEGVGMSRPIKPPLPRRTLAFVRQLRSAGTDAEGLLWYHLRAKRFQALKWRRQHPLPPYIVDFGWWSRSMVGSMRSGAMRYVPSSWLRRA